jgi:sporulation protein YlmC with PRC-barrel domain
MNLDELRGRPVITIDGGERMGTVSDGVVDVGQRKLVSLLVTAGGLLGGSRHTLRTESIHRIGPDAIMVQNRASLQEGENVPESLVRGSDMRKRSVITESGRELGFVADLHLSDDYAFSDVEMSTNGGLLGIFGSTTKFPVSEVVAFGDVVTVRDSLVRESA